MWFVQIQDINSARASDVFVVPGSCGYSDIVGHEILNMKGERRCQG